MLWHLVNQLVVMKLLIHQILILLVINLNLIVRLLDLDVLVLLLVKIYKLKQFVNPILIAFIHPIAENYKMIVPSLELRVFVLIHLLLVLLLWNVLGIMKVVKEFVVIGNVMMLLKQLLLMMLVKHYIQIVLLKEMVVLKSVLVQVILLQLYVKQLKLLIKEIHVFGIKHLVEPKNAQMHPKPLKLIKNVMDTYLIV